MNWKTIRLELGPTSDFPKGSVSRAFLIRVPVAESGVIDEAAVDKDPAHATVRRHWPSQPDRSGRVVRHQGRWAFQFGPASADNMFLLESGKLVPGNEVTVRDPDGTASPFRVASLKGLA